jgi:hypothetical protein
MSSRTYHPASRFENLFLLLSHNFCFLRSLILPSGEMQQPVNDAKGGFFGGRMAEALCIFRHNPGSYEDFSIRKSDNIGRRAILEELAVDFGDRSVAENSGFYLLQPVQSRSRGQRGRVASWQGALYQSPHQSEIKGKATLSVSN